jgi:chorismate mutase
MDLDYDGLMLESHIDPDKAWSDAAQQVTPETLKDMINSIVVREPQFDESTDHAELDQLREKINHIDDELLNLLNNRMQVAREIGLFKKNNNLTILQKSRWNEILEKGKEYANSHDLSENFIQAYLQSVHDESITQQERVMNEE